MPELSNLLRQRLGAQTSAEQNGAVLHPDADTLTAYSEQQLPAAESQQVLQHLSVCGECREVLALSQVEVAESALQPVLKPAPVSFWRKLFSPAFGIAGLVAAMALIAVVVLQAPHKPGETQARQEPAVARSSDDQKTAAQPQPAAPAQPETARSFSGQEAGPQRGKQPEAVAGLAAMNKTSVLANKIASARQAAPAPVQPVFTAALKKQDFVNNALFDTRDADVIMDGQSNPDFPSAPRPQPAASDARFNVNAPGQITSFSDIPANAAKNKSSIAILTPPPPREHFGLRLDKLVIQGARSVFRPPTSAPAIRSNSLGTSAMIAAPRFSDTTKAESAVAAAPAKSDAGEFAASGALSAPARRSLSSAETAAATWKVAEGKLLKAFGQSAWEEAHTPAAFQFTAVSAHGGEVWAGGTNAGLIHSYDGGNTWNMVKLGEAASGAIVSILFAGNNVQIKTSDDQSWSSADGGKSWTQN